MRQVRVNSRMPVPYARKLLPYVYSAVRYPRITRTLRYARGYPLTQAVRTRTQSLTLPYAGLGTRTPESMYTPMHTRQSLVVY